MIKEELMDIILNLPVEQRVEMADQVLKTLNHRYSETTPLGKTFIAIEQTNT